MSINLASAMLRVRTIIGEEPHNLPTYSTGTVTVTLASAVVTGSGTAWLTNVIEGQTFHILNGQYYHILSVDSDTQITLATTYGETSGAGKSYTVKGGKTTNATIIDNLNGAQHEMVNAIEEFDQNFFATSGTISYVSGTEVYPLPTTNGVVRKTLRIIRTDLAYEKPLYKINLQDRTQYLINTSSNIDTRNTDEYWYLFGTNIGIVPIPTATITNNIKVHYVPEATNMTLDTSTAIIPDSYFDVLCYTAAIRSSLAVVPIQQKLWNQMMSTIRSRDSSEPRMINYIPD